MATTTEIEQVADVLCATWEEFAPVVAEVRRRTNLTQTQVMLLLVLGDVIADDDEDGSRPRSE